MMWCRWPLTAYQHHWDLLPTAPSSHATHPVLRSYCTCISVDPSTAHRARAAGPREGAAMAVQSAQELLDDYRRVWPGWSKNAHRLIKESGIPLADAPSSQQAAAALKSLAKQAIKLPPAERASELARHRVVLGLIECLRVTPPRGPPSGVVSPSRLPPAVAAADMARELQQRHEVQQPRLIAAELSGAMWSLAVLGGDVHYRAEMEGLAAQLAGTQFDRLLQVADVCWALGTSRHWTDHLPLLEQEAVRLAKAGLGRQQTSSVSLDGATPIDTSSHSSGSSGGAGSGSVTCQQISTIVWGLSVLGYPSLHLLGLLPELVQHWEQQSSSQQAAFGGTSSSSPARHTGPPSRRQATPTLPSLCTLAWAMAVAGQAPVAAWKAVLGALARLVYTQQQQQGSTAGIAEPGKTAAGKAGTAQQKQLMQLHQVALALATAGGGKEGLLKGLLAGEGLHREAVMALEQLFEGGATAAAGLAREKGHLKSSGCQADVANTLRSLGLPPTEEYQVMAGLTVDAAVPRLRLAVEVDGPTHFTRNPAPPLCLQEHGSEGEASSAPAAAAAHSRNTVQGGRPVGATLLKHRLLEQHGWRVVHVDSEAWEQLRGPERKRACLEAGLRAAGVKIGK